MTFFYAIPHVLAVIKRAVFGVVLLLVVGCANSQYAGVNYGEVIDPSGAHWIVVGGKDETNVTFTIKRPDGTEVTYTAEKADASTALATALEYQARALEAATGLVKGMVVKP